MLHIVYHLTVSHCKVCNALPPCTHRRSWQQLAFFNMKCRASWHACFVF
jgi:hypothetical protein